MPHPLNEFDVLKRCLPLERNITKYLCVKTKVNNYDDLEFRMEVDLEKTVRKFAHSSWNEMRPLVVGIKCYTNTDAAVFVNHGNRDRLSPRLIDSFDVLNDTWYTFKYPLLANYHTDTRILLSEGVTAFTLAILDSSSHLRDTANSNTLPPGYASFDTMLYGSFNKALVYSDEAGALINPSGADLKDAHIVTRI
jgi:hypothetical protein